MDILPPEGYAYIDDRRARRVAKTLGLHVSKARVGSRKTPMGVMPVYRGVFVRTHDFAALTEALRPKTTNQDKRAAVEAALRRARAMGDYETAKDLENELSELD